jgi:hypothetical protein
LRALINPFVDAAVLELSPRQLLQDGILTDRLAAAIFIGPVSENALQLQEVTNNTSGVALSFSSADLERASRVPLEILQDSGILVMDATHPDAAGFGIGAQHVVYFAPTADNAVLLEHTAAGGTGCVCTGDTVWLYSNRTQSRIGPLPDTFDRNSSSELAAAFGAAAGLGLQLTQLAAGLAAANAELG